MFTGIIDDVGTVSEVEQNAAGRALRIACRYVDLVPGESVAVSGVCLTVRECGPKWFVVAAVTTTIGRTGIGDLKGGSEVNLERALRLGDRLGGHMVQGHVDGQGTVQSVKTVVDARLVDVEIPADLTDLVVQRGSIALDGVSLTVNEILRSGVVQVALIDYTLRHTTLSALATGDKVNVEVDSMAKHIRRLAEPYLTRELVTNAIRND